MPSSKIASTVGNRYRTPQITFEQSSKSQNEKKTGSDIRDVQEQNMPKKKSQSSGQNISDRKRLSDAPSRSSVNRKTAAVTSGQNPNRTRTAMHQYRLLYQQIKRSSEMQAQQQVLQFQRSEIRVLQPQRLEVQLLRKHHQRQLR